MMSEYESWDHSAGWRSSGVARRYDAKRAAKLTGRLADAMEERTVLRMLGSARRRGEIRTVLDLPCGTGRISRLLDEQRLELVCSDVSEAMVAIAKERFRDLGIKRSRFVVADGYRTAYPADCFDCVTCIRLFQHLDSQQRARVLAELCRISKRFVIVNVMYSSFYYGMMRRLRQATGRYAPKHTTSQEELDRELRHAGLACVERRFTQPGYNGNLVLLLEKAVVDGAD